MESAINIQQEFSWDNRSKTKVKCTNVLCHLYLG